jgi:hypothetical protein
MEALSQTCKHTQKNEPIVPATSLKENIKNAIVLIRFNYYSKSKKAKKKKISFLLNPSATLKKKKSKCKCKCKF